MNSKSRNLAKTFHGVWLLWVLTAHPLMAKVPAAATDLMRDMERHQQMQALNRTFFPPDDESSPPMRSFLEVYAEGGVASGYGEIHIRFKPGNHNVELYKTKPKATFHPGSERAEPEFAYLDLNGIRYFPRQTDSIRVWGVVGIPFQKSHWVFLLARGPINAYAHFPGPAALYFSKEAKDEFLLSDSTRFFGVDSLRSLLRRCPRAWAESQDDPLMAVTVFNGAKEEERRAFGEPDMLYREVRAGWSVPKRRREEILAQKPKDYLLRVGMARALCSGKRFDEAENDLAVLRSLDSSFYQYYWVAAECKEAAGQFSEALRLYHRAAIMAPADARFREKMRKAIEKLDKKVPDTGQTIRTEKVPRPKSASPSGGYHYGF